MAEPSTQQNTTGCPEVYYFERVVWKFLVSSKEVFMLAVVALSLRDRAHYAH